MDYSDGPLSGIRVIDLTSVVMGPYCTQIMADMGADIIKIESPAGDNIRSASTGMVPGMSGMFININRGKRSLVLNLTDEGDKETLRQLIASADVFIHSMRGKAISKLGFDYSSVSAIQPSIVYTNCYGYSRRGPNADQPAYDDTMQAECGITAVQEQLTGKASFVGSIMADKVTGLTALYSTMMALFHRQRSGEGQEVEVGMFETMASFMLVEHADQALFDPPIGPAYYHRAVAPNRKPYQTRDGYIAALVYNDKHWAAFTAAVKPDWATDELATLAQRAGQINRVYGLLGETFRERTTEEWLTLLRELNIPCAPLRTPGELFDNEHLQAIDFFQYMDTAAGKVRFPGIPTWFSRTPGRIRGGAPALGAHNEEILQELKAANDEPSQA